MSFALLAALLMIGWLLWSSVSRMYRRPTLRGNFGSAPIGYFGGFVRGPEEPWVIFKQCGVCGPAKHWYAVLRRGERCESPILIHYTGVGNAGGAQPGHCIRQLHQATRKTRQFVFAGRCEDNDLIFMGSPSENLTLLGNSKHHEFVSERSTVRKRETWRS